MQLTLQTRAVLLLTLHQSNVVDLLHQLYYTQPSSSVYGCCLFSSLYYRYNPSPIKQSYSIRDIDPHNVVDHQHQHEY